MTFQDFDKTQRQLIGLLLQTVVPILLAFTAIRALLLGGDLGRDPAAAWVYPLVFSVPPMVILWALPYGKRLYWRDSWRSLSAPPALPSTSQVDADQNHYYVLLPGQSPRKGMVIWLAAWPCCILVFSLIIWSAHRFLDNPHSMSGGLSASMVPVYAIAFDQSRKMFLRARRHLKPAIASPEHLPPGSYVLYLRPFEDDARRAAVKENNLFETRPTNPSPLWGSLMNLVISSRDEEEHMADALSPVGPLFAVGSPEEIRLYAGALRTYLPKDSWKESVKHLIHGARLTVLALGSSKGTMWEIAEAMRSLPPQRLLLMVPGGMEKKEYDMIRETTALALQDVSDDGMNRTWKNNTPPSLPTYASPEWRTDPVVSIIHFSADWEPTITRTPYKRDAPWGNLFTRLTHSLRPALIQLVAYEEKTKRHYG
ncbi:hypothetical protein ABZS93_08865 [Streptomyces sp900116325]|uniref:hypothetical protein n=1 Tax=Streptomyces sp. 900116325 TaxID=3154295 RepID=UPI0033BE206D